MAAVEYRLNNHIAVITMNRPERLNALNREAFEGLAEAFSEFEKNPDAWVAILTGAGKAFTVGLDLKEALAEDPTNVKLPQTKIRDVYLEDEFHKPVIAAINGYAVGGGFFLALKADLRIATESAIFQISEVQRGITSGIYPPKHWVLHANLPQAINCQLLSGMRLDAKRAYEVGFVNKIVQEDVLMDEALAMAENFVSVPPLAPYYNLKALRQLRRARCEMPVYIEEEIRIGTERCYMSEDMKEATRAFVGKYKPSYKRK